MCSPAVFDQFRKYKFDTFSVCLYFKKAALFCQVAIQDFKSVAAICLAHSCN